MDVALARVPDELIAADPKLARYAGGLAHATAYVPNVSEFKGVQHAQFPQNRERFARLLVLFSWMVASDHQFMYGLAAPHLVYSHDHGLFFPGQAQWTRQSLAAVGQVQLDAKLAAIGFTPAELQLAAAELRGVTDLEIAEAVGFIPVEWSVPGADLTALTDYMTARRTSVLDLIDRTR
jgi:hypothetical protein